MTTLHPPTLTTVDDDAPLSDDRRLEQVAPVTTIGTRLREVLSFQAGDVAVRAARRLPGLRDRVDRARTVPLKSSSIAMLRWWKAPYGSDAKPASLEEVPWDYVAEHEDRIPFRGLREYWYPALQSSQLRHNDAVPITLGGDGIVLFRDAEGRPRALENRCPHRSPLLSLGQVGVWEPGTITCRYHGMTFDGDGNCVAFLADGPDSPLCGKATARSYPVEEHNGIVFVHLGDGDGEPEPLFDAQPHARDVLTQQRLVVQRVEVPYSYLTMVDNATDLAHVGCLHRSCVAFGDHRMHGEIQVEDLDDGRGVLASYVEDGGHAGPRSVERSVWYLPGVNYREPGELNDAMGHSLFWFVPNDVGHFTAWLVAGLDDSGGRVGNAVRQALLQFMLERGEFPGLNCFLAGDAPMQASQGRVPRWDLDRLARTDRPVIRVRRMLMDAHQAEVGQRARRAADAQQARRARAGATARPAAPATGSDDTEGDEA